MVEYEALVAKIDKLQGDVREMQIEQRFHERRLDRFEQALARLLVGPMHERVEALPVIGLKLDGA
jgi:hypothetical protein